MSVWLPVKMCIWDRQLTYLVRNCVSNLTMRFNTCSVLFLSHTFSKGAVIPEWFPRSEFAMTLVASRPEDAFIDLLADSISRTTILSSAVKIAFWILSWTVSTILLIFLSIFSLKQVSKVFTVTVFSLTTKPLSELPMVNSRSPLPSITVVFSCPALAVLPMMTSWSKSSNWPRSLLFYCLFLRVETMSALKNLTVLETIFSTTIRQCNGNLKWRNY